MKSCMNCMGDCCEHIDFCEIADFYDLGFDYLSYFGGFLRMDLYDGMEIIIRPSVYEVVEWLLFFGFEWKPDDGNFRCSYHDPITGKCTIYNNRPNICRKYTCPDMNRWRKKY